MRHAGHRYPTQLRRLVCAVKDRRWVQAVALALCLASAFIVGHCSGGDPQDNASDNAPEAASDNSD